MLPALNVYTHEIQSKYRIDDNWKQMTIGKFNLLSIWLQQTYLANGVNLSQISWLDWIYSVGY